MKNTAKNFMWSIILVKRESNRQSISYKEDFDAKGVRLDVYVNDGKGTVYDIEMQAVTSP